MNYDDGYVPNKSCPCLRCRLKGVMGGVVLMTVGVIQLLHNFTNGWGMHNFWPLLLIVIGLMLFAQRSASTEGHIQPLGYPPMPGTAPGTSPFVPPPAAPTASDNINPNPGSGAENHG